MARVEQTETPQQLEARNNEKTSSSKEKVVKRLLYTHFNILITSESYAVLLQQQLKRMECRMVKLEDSIRLTLETNIFLL